MYIKYNFNNPLPAPYEQMMPSGFDAYQQFQWRQRKLNDLILQNLAFVDSEGCVSFSDNISVSESNVSEKKDDSAIAAIEIPEVQEESKDDSDYESPVDVSSKQTRRKTAKVVSPSKTELETIKYVPVTVLEAIRKIFPVSASKADLISAVVYIFTNGGCEISEKAMDLVQAYEKEDKIVSIDERLARLENANRRQLEMLQSIELCTCFNTFDRRYGSSMPRKGAKNTEFRETGNLDMLARLRVQAKDQLNADEKERGRQIYNSVKDLHD